MMSKLFALAGLWLFSGIAIAQSGQELLSTLHDRMVTLPGNGSLIRSFKGHDQSYIYDQALAIIAFSKNHDQKSAKKLMRALASLQLRDGSLYFSYNLDGSSPYPHEGDRRFAGAIAWVALAATHYQAEFRSSEFVTFNRNILNYLSSEIRPFDALRFGPSDMKDTPWKENETSALEHNLDAYSAFTHFAALNPGYAWNTEIKTLKKFILSMWDNKRSHFWSGINIRTRKTNMQELYLDNQTWSLLALDQKTLESLDTKEALALNCEDLYVEKDGIAGFVDSRSASGPKKYEFVWSEGTLGQIMAMEKTGHQCEQKTSAELLASIMKMKKSDGGIAYATKNKNPDFTSASSVAGTAWMYFAVNRINPFDVTPAPSASFQIAQISDRVR